MSSAPFGKVIFAMQQFFDIENWPGRPRRRAGNEIEWLKDDARCALPIRRLERPARPARPAIRGE